jgi:hypothetical protein
VCGSLLDDLSKLTKDPKIKRESKRAKEEKKYKRQNAKPKYARMVEELNEGGVSGWVISFFC